MEAFETFWRPKAAPNSVMTLGCFFVGFWNAAGLWRAVDAPETQVLVPRIPLGGAPFARGGILQTPGSQVPAYHGIASIANEI